MGERGFQDSRSVLLGPRDGDVRMESSGADSRGGGDRFPEGGLGILRRRFWKEGTVRNKSQKSKRCLQVWHQEKSMFNPPKACNVRKRHQEVEEEGG